jgi:hypothetical protein
MALWPFIVGRCQGDSWLEVQSFLGADSLQSSGAPLRPSRLLSVPFTGRDTAHRATALVREWWVESGIDAWTRAYSAFHELWIA